MLTMLVSQTHLLISLNAADPDSQVLPYSITLYLHWHDFSEVLVLSLASSREIA